MKSLKTASLIVISFIAVSLVTATAIHQQTRDREAAVRSSATAAKHYTVRGEIRGIDGMEVRIKHEAIPDYMAAMTMPFEVKDRALLRGLHTGDQVSFELVVTESDSWISHIDQTPEPLGRARRSARAAAASPASAREPLIERTTTQVSAGGPTHPGETVPDFSLIDQDGRPFRLNDFRGKAVLLTFIYTRCPLPNYCPLMSQNFAALQQRLEKEFPGQFQLISVSIDPQFDRPEVLKQYAARFTRSQAHWIFGTGSSEQSDAVGALFGLVQERAGGLINHDLRTALIAPDGRLVHVWKSNLWTPYEVQRRVAETLGKTAP